MDWEEITTIDGDLLVCDIGDNGRSRNDLMLYRAHYESGTLTLVARYPIAYPDASHDAEAAAVVDGHLHIVSKAREDRVTNVYRFEELIDEATLTPGRKNVPELVSQLDIGDGEQVTAGTYDPHTGTLILLTYSGILQYPKDRLSGEPDKTTQIVARQCEAICLVDDTLVVTNEQRDVFALPGFLDYPVTKLLPPPAHIALPRTPMNIPLSAALPGERLLWWTENDSLVVTGRFQSKDDAIPMGQAAPRVGTCVLLMFARDPSWWVSDTDTQIGIGIDEQGVVALWRVKLRGTPTATRLSAGRVRGRFVDSVLLFEARIPMGSLFTEAVPDTFLFDVQGIRLHGADEEPYFSAPGNFSAYRPYAWGTASLAP